MAETFFDMSKLNDSISEVVTNSLKHFDSIKNNNDNYCISKENECTNVTIQYNNKNDPKIMSSNNGHRRLSLDMPSPKHDHKFIKAKKMINIDQINSPLNITSNSPVLLRRHTLSTGDLLIKNSPILKEHRLDLSSSTIGNKDFCKNTAINKYPVFSNGTPRRIKLVSKKKESASTLKSDGMTGIFQLPVKKIIEDNLTVSVLKLQLKRTLSSCYQSPPVKRLAGCDAIESAQFDNLYLSPISTQDILSLEDENKLQSLTYLNTVKNGQRIAKITKTKYDNFECFKYDDICKEASKVRWRDDLASVFETNNSDNYFSDTLSSDDQSSSSLPQQINNKLPILHKINLHGDANNLLGDSPPLKEDKPLSDISINSVLSTQVINSKVILSTSPSPDDSNCDTNCDIKATPPTNIDSKLNKNIKPILNLKKLNNKIYPFNCETPGRNGHSALIPLLCVHG